MPHVDIKCFPRDLTDEQKTALAADIAEAIARHLNSKVAQSPWRFRRFRKLTGRRRSGIPRSARNWMN